jgi:hypothetical protein
MTLSVSGVGVEMQIWFIKVILARIRERQLRHTEYRT